jgi:mannitol-1-/sugar-/sorbitol-6-/2-deoxyglucose-6-phosphatase
MTPSAVIFDMDGLLVDSESVWHIAEKEMIESRGHIYTDEARAQIVGLRMDEFIVKLHAIYQFEDELAALHDQLLTRMLELIPERVNPQPGARELIDYIVEHNIPTAIASSSAMSIIEATIKAQGWEEVFAVRCSAEHEAHGKPAPDVYLTAARRLNIDPAECLALEDSPNGARAAVAAGMTCYAVPDSTHTSIHSFDGITPHIYKSLHEVLAVLRA